MTRYENGRAPLSDLVKVGDEQYLPAGTAARWRELQRLAWEKYRVWLVISAGWNAYRPYAVQVQYRQELGIWAAVPGTSSHGLTYQGRDCAAIDVYNWASLGWARFVALCRIVGFTVDFVTPQELWHIGDFDPFTVPAFAAITINPATTALPPMSEEDDMPTIISSPLGQSLAVGGVVVGFPTPADVQATKSTSGAPVQIMETSAVMHTSILEASRRRDPVNATLPVIVAAAGGNGTVYILQDAQIRALTDPTTLADLESRGALTVVWPQGEIDSLIAQQKG